MTAKLKCDLTEFENMDDMQEPIDTQYDIDFEKSLRIAQPLLEQIDKPDLVRTCKIWIEKLKKYAVNKSLRNKYLFFMAFQLARGYVDQPFLEEPPEHLDDFGTQKECSESSSSCTLNSDSLYDSKTIQEPSELWQNAAAIVSDNENYVSISNSETPTKILLVPESKHQKDRELNKPLYRNVETKELQDEKADFEEQETGESMIQPMCSKQQKSESNSDRVNSVGSTSSRESRLRNLIHKIRELKKTKESEPFHIKSIQKEPELQVTYPNMAKMEINFLNKKNKALMISKSMLVRKLKTCEQQIWVLEEVKEKQGKEIAALKAEKSQDYGLEAKKIQESIETLKTDLEAKLSLYTRETLRKTQDFQRKYDEINYNDLMVRVNTLNLEVQRLQENQNNLKTSVSQSANKTTNTEISNVNYEEKIERKLAKLMRNKTKMIKTFEVKVNHLEQENQLLMSRLQLLQLQDRNTRSNGVASSGISLDDFNKSIESLEKRYMRMVAVIQATAIKTRMQDQKNMETILQSMKNRALESTVGASSDKSTSTVFPHQHNDSEDFETINHETDKIYTIEHYMNCLGQDRLASGDNHLPDSDIPQIDCKGSNNNCKLG